MATAKPSDDGGPASALLYHVRALIRIVKEQQRAQETKPSYSGTTRTGAGKWLEPSWLRSLHLMLTAVEAQLTVPGCTAASCSPSPDEPDDEHLAVVPRNNPACNSDGSLSLDAIIAALACMAPGGVACQFGQLPAEVAKLLFESRGSHLTYGRTLGKGAFGTVVEAHNRLDGRVAAVKKIPFRSPHPPWTSLEVVEEHHEKLLREVRVLAMMDGSPHVVKYFWAWIEPRWEAMERYIASWTAAASAAANQQLQSPEPAPLRMIRGFRSTPTLPGDQSKESVCRITVLGDSESEDSEDRSGSPFFPSSPTRTELSNGASSEEMSDYVNHQLFGRRRSVDDSQ
eukprot:CAMPEP_0118923808 /NCGR_PEP_ID=MMETSP1169-20130426/2200_1 /TAXON_ID=36882 /ORGANISM="Pyramimonas obovata, Strain CCMP722" /LENGTH=341 /DNA_ID=CAMNT_0006864857 /DNA_START=175 /DNA_END=1197 /DNA_ORIENTATION=-